MSDRDLTRDTRRRVAGSVDSFDRFTIELVGKVYNGETIVYDESGGLLGRMDKRVKALELGHKNIVRTLIGMLLLMLAMKGVDNIKGIGEVLDKIATIFH